MDGGVIKKANNAHNRTHISLKNIIERIGHLCYTVGGGMNQFVLQVNLTVYEKTKGGTHMVGTKSSFPTTKKVKAYSMEVERAKRAASRDAVVHGRNSRVSSFEHLESPIIFSKGSELYIVESTAQGWRNVKPLTREILRDVESNKIRIDTRGMSRVQVASIVKAISEE